MFLNILLLLLLTSDQPTRSIRCASSNIADTLRSLPSNVSESLRCLAHNVPQTVCGLARNVSYAFNRLADGSCDGAEKAALSFLFFTAGQSVV
jgi:hypothetical protein